MATLSSPYDYVSGQQTSLAVNLTPTQTSGFKLATIRRNGETEAWTATSGIIEIRQERNGELIQEWVSFNGLTTNADNTVTLTAANVSRGIAINATLFTGTGTGQRFNKGAEVRLVLSHQSINNKADKDRANSFSVNQTISNGIKILFGDSDAYIWTENGGTDLKFKDANNSERTLSQLSAAAGTDEKLKVSSNDTTARYLLQKLVAGNAITFTETTDGGDETYVAAVALNTDPGLEFNSSLLRVKTKSGGGITRDSQGLSVDVTASIFGALSRFFGTGADGAKAIAASEDLNPASDFNYTTFSLSAGQTMSVTSVNSPLIINVTGDATINGTIDLNGKGAAGGALGAGRTGSSGAGTNGGTATAGASRLSGLATGAATGGEGGDNTPDSGGGGGGGASAFAAGTAGLANVDSSGGDAGTVPSAVLMTWMANIGRGVVCGGGGGGGGGGGRAAGADGTNGGAGGAGGGAMIMYIGGNLTLGASSIIRANGVAGGDGVIGSAAEGGGGGGGAGGAILILVGGTITNSGVTTSASGGAGGLTNNAADASGGAGASGRVLIYSIADNTLISA